MFSKWSCSYLISISSFLLPATHLTRVSPSACQLLCDCLLHSPYSSKGSASPFSEGINSYHFTLCRPHSLCLHYSVLLLCHKGAIDKTQTKQGGCVPKKPYWWALKLEFHIVFTCREVFSLFWFFPLLLQREKPGQLTDHPKMHPTPWRCRPPPSLSLPFSFSPCLSTLLSLFLSQPSHHQHWTQIQYKQIFKYLCLLDKVLCFSL